MTPNQIVQILLAVLALLSAAFGLIGYIARSFIKYLFDRVATLETREQTILTGLVATAENLQTNQQAIADFVTTLVDEKKYERRRDEDEQRRREGGR
jgi:chorismate mutase